MFILPAVKVHRVCVFHSEAANLIKMLVVFVSPDDSGSRGGAGAASGVSDHSPELAGKLGNHRLNIIEVQLQDRV